MHYSLRLQRDHTVNIHMLEIFLLYKTYVARTLQKYQQLNSPKNIVHCWKIQWVRQYFLESQHIYTEKKKNCHKIAYLIRYFLLPQKQEGYYSSTKLNTIWDLGWEKKHLPWLIYECGIILDNYMLFHLDAGSKFITCELTLIILILNTLYFCKLWG